MVIITEDVNVEKYIFDERNGLWYERQGAIPAAIFFGKAYFSEKSIFFYKSAWQPNDR